MKEGYDQNSSDVSLSVADLVQDYAVKHVDNMSDEMIDDLFVLLEEALGDGFIAGFNLGVEELEKAPEQLEWWEHQDDDEAWIADAAQLTLEELEAYERDSRWGSDLSGEDLPPGSPFYRSEKDD